MKYILRDKITINRPIVFLCGPYYQKDNKSDRRNVMRSYFMEHYGTSVLPLIIDDFLTETNIKDPTVNIQLLEEIFAAISYKTYIFLDTLSAASELGLFMNHAFANQVVAYIPKESDILNKKNVGYFAKDVILKMNANQAKCIEYRPSITRSVLATDYAVEHYGFIGDVIPENIASEILNDSIYKDREVRDVVLEESEDYPKEDFQICYQKHDGDVTLHVSITLLFYIVSSLMYENHAKKLVNNPKATIQDFEVTDIREMTAEVLVNYLIENGIPVNGTLQITTILNFTFEDIIYHMVTFCYVYHCFSTYRGLRLVEGHMDTILDSYAEIQGKNPLDVFGVSQDDYDLILQCKDNPYAFCEKFTLSSGGKKRELVRYADDENGMSIRRLHEEIAEALQRNYDFSDCSFAYKKGSSILSCANLHRDNNAFAKYDISKFFHSINQKKLIAMIEKKFGIDPAYAKITENIIGSFFVEGRLPLGLVVSPVLSDIYMSDFDAKLQALCSTKGYVYTRYADDILVSQKNTFTDEAYEQLDETMTNYLKAINLKVNIKKKKRIFLEHDGQHIKYIGVNIVHFNAGNRISVGRQYIYNVVKEYYQYLEARDKARTMTQSDATLDEHLFYQERRIAGRIAFIRAIEGESGWEKVKKRLGNRPELIDDNKLYFG